MQFRKKGYAGCAVFVRTCILLPAVAISCIAASRTALAETLTVPANELKSLFDYTNPYRGQTFMFPEAVRANKLTVFVSSNIYQEFSFHLLLTEVDTANGVHPTKVLFESGPFDIPVGGHNVFIPCTADLGGIQLSGGQVYAFILDIFVTLRQVNTDTLWQYATLTGMNREASYPSGGYIYLKVDCTEPLTGLPCGSREDHFAGSWVAETSEDMGFILDYTPDAPLPPPTTVLPAIELLLLRGE